MAQHDVETTPVRVARAGQQPVIANEGPGDLFWDYTDQVDTDTGFPIKAGAGYEFPRDLAKDLWVVSESDSDVRVQVVG